MTVVRLAQAGAETRNIDEVTSFAITDPAISSTQAYTGTYSFLVQGGGNNSYGFAFPDAYTAMRLNYMFRYGTWNTVGADYIYLARFYNAGTEVMSVRINDTDNLATLWINGVEQDSVSMASVGLLDANTWRSLGATVHIGAPGYASFYVDGVQALNYVGTITGQIDNMRFSDGEATSLSNAYVDDIYVDSIVGEADGAPSTRRFMWTLPDGAGENAEWTPNTGTNVGAVDEAVPDNDTTYIKTLVPGVTDTYNFASVTIPVDHVIRAVIPTVLVRKTDAATPAEITLHCFDGLLYDTSGALDNLPTQYLYRFARFTEQPDASAWNETDLNAMQFGVDAAGAW